MSVLKKRNERFLAVGFENLEGNISVNKFFEKGLPITSLSVNIKNIFAEDIDYIVSELIKHKDYLSTQFNESLELLKKN